MCDQLRFKAILKRLTARLYCREAFLRLPFTTLWVELCNTTPGAHCSSARRAWPCWAIFFAGAWSECHGQDGPGINKLRHHLDEVFSHVFSPTIAHILMLIQCHTYTMSWFLLGHYLIMASFAESRRQRWFQPRRSTKALQSHPKNLAWRDHLFKETTS